MTKNKKKNKKNKNERWRFLKLLFGPKLLSEPDKRNQERNTVLPPVGHVNHPLTNLTRSREAMMKNQQRFQQNAQRMRNFR